MEFGNVGFYGGRKTGEPGEKPSEQGREPTTNSTHILHRDRESNPVGGERSHHCAIPAPLNKFNQNFLFISYFFLFFLSFFLVFLFCSEVSAEICCFRLSEISSKSRNYLPVKYVNIVSFPNQTEVESWV